MRTSRRSVLAAAVLGLAGCTGSSDTSELDPDDRPERPAELDRERVATYLREYERAYMLSEGIDRSRFDDPDEAVSMDCRAHVEASSPETYVGAVQCDGTIEPDVGDAVPFGWGLAAAPVYRVTPSTTQRIDPELAGRDASHGTDGGPTVSLTVANVSDADWDVSVEVVPLGREPFRTNGTVPAASARGFEQIAATAELLEVSVSVDGTEAALGEHAVDASVPAGVFVFVDAEDEVTVTTASGTV